MPGRQNAQAQHFGDPERIRLIIGMLQPVVLPHLGRVGQYHWVAVLAQAVDQPVPVVGGFHRNGMDVLLMGCECVQNTRQIAG